MIAVAWGDLWAQFAALAASVLLLAALSKLGFVRRLVRQNVTDPFHDWLKEILRPTNEKIEGVHERVYELADMLGYEFSANGGNSLRDRVDAGVRAVGGPPAPEGEHKTSID